MTIFKSMVLPHLDYLDIVFANTSQINQIKLQRVQNHALHGPKYVFQAFLTKSLGQGHHRRHHHQSVGTIMNVANGPI